MATKGLPDFTEELKTWVLKNPEKDAALRNIVGICFSNAGKNPEFRDNELYKLLNEKTEYTTTSRLHNVIQAGKQRSKGRFETHVALYYLAKIDETYQSYVEVIESHLFGEGKTFLDVFRWCPNGVMAAMPGTGSEQAPVSTPLGNQLRLRPPGVHSHPSHFSNRAIKEIIGREAEQETLRRFVGPQPGFRWLQLAGAGGQGKSRMAYDLMRELGDEWKKGFLDKADLDEFQGKPGDYRPDSWRDWTPTKPHLIIIDYVIGRESDIGFAMNQMADRSDEFSVPVCVLLIERQRWDQGAFQPDLSSRRKRYTPLSREGRANWFVKLNGRDQPNGKWRNDLAAKALIFDLGVIELESLYKRDVVKVVRDLIEKEDTANLSDFSIIACLDAINANGNPLLSHFVAEFLSSQNNINNWNISSVICYVFEQHYRKIWNPTWGDKRSLSVRHPATELAVLATMIGRVDCEKYAATLEREYPSDLVRSQAMALTGGMSAGDELGPGHIISALEPGILGEWFAIHALESCQMYQDLISAAWNISPHKFIAFLSRVIADFPTDPVSMKLLRNVFTGDLTADPIGVFPAYIAHCMLSAGMEIPIELINCLEASSSDASQVAYFTLGMVYASREHEEDSQSSAFSCFLAGAFHGEYPAMLELANLYLDESETPGNEEEGLFWLEIAAEGGHSDAMFRLGEVYKDRGEFANAFEWFRAAACKGHDRGLLMTMLFYEYGIGVTQSTYHAKLWYIKCCEVMPQYFVNELLAQSDISLIRNTCAKTS